MQKYNKKINLQRKTRKKLKKMTPVKTEVNVSC